MAALSLTVCLIGASLGVADDETEPQSRFEGHGGPVRAIFVSDDGNTALTASFDYSIIGWSIEDNSPSEKFLLDEHEAAVNDIELSDDGAIAVSASDDGTVGVWDIKSEKLLRRFEGHNAKVLSVALSPDGRMAASAGWDSTARLWDIENLEPGPVLEGHRGHVNTVAFSRDGSQIYTGSYDGTIRVWDAESGGYTGLIYRHGWGINVMELLPDGKSMLIGAIDGVVGVVDLDSGEMTELAKYVGPVLAVAIWPQHGLAASGGGNGTIRVWKLDGWELLHTHEDPYGPAWSLAISGDGTRIYKAGLDDFVHTWQISPRKPFEPVASVYPRRFQITEDMDAGEREFARKCSICHTLTPDGGRRAGPTLYGVFGRRAGTLPGYSYSASLENSDIVWTAETIGQLFDEGPEVMTPGSKMPAQRLKEVENRDALIAYLETATAPENDDSQENSGINEETEAQPDGEAQEQE